MTYDKNKNNHRGNFLDYEANLILAMKGYSIIFNVLIILKSHPYFLNYWYLNHEANLKSDSHLSNKLCYLLD